MVSDKLIDLNLYEVKNYNKIINIIKQLYIFIYYIKVIMYRIY